MIFVTGNFKFGDLILTTNICQNKYVVIKWELTKGVFRPDVVFNLFL